MGVKKESRKETAGVGRTEFGGFARGDRGRTALLSSYNFLVLYSPKANRGEKI